MASTPIGTPAAASKLPLIADRVEQVLIAALYVLLTWRVFHADNPLAPLLLVSEGSVLVFTLLRRPTGALSFNPSDWVLAMIGTLLPLMVEPVADRVPALVPVGVTLFAIGLIAQISAKLSLRRSFGIAPANRGVKRGGMYRFVRHPMYAGYFVSNVAMLLLMFSPLNLAIYATAWAAQVWRILAEEAFLAQDPDYRAYMAEQRWRVVPGIF